MYRRKFSLHVAAVVLGLSTTAVATPVDRYTVHVGDASGALDATIDLPITLSSSRDLEAVTVVLDWAPGTGTLVELVLDPQLSAAANFVDSVTNPHWVAFGFTSVSTPIPAGNDVPLATLRLRCNAAQASLPTAVVLRDGTYRSGPASPLIENSVLPTGEGTITAPSGLTLENGSFRCTVSERCDDGVDNDGDGAVDCGDSDCVSSTLCLPILEVSPTIGDFGPVPVGEQRLLVFALKNTGRGSTTLMAFEVEGSDTFEVTAAPPSGTVMSSGDDFLVTVRFVPGVTGAANAALRIRSDAGDLFIPLSGLGEVSTVTRHFVRGDSNDDGEVNLTDGVHLLDHLFRGDPPPPLSRRGRRGRRRLARPDGRRSAPQLALQRWSPSRSADPEHVALSAHGLRSRPDASRRPEL